MDATTQTQTQADQIAARYQDDGQVFRDAEGIELTEALRKAGASVDRRDGSGDVVRYTLPDRSVITVAGDAWDLGYADCYCWQGAGHDKCSAEADDAGEAL